MYTESTADMMQGCDALSVAFKQTIDNCQSVNLTRTHGRCLVTGTIFATFLHNPQVLSSHTAQPPPEPRTKRQHVSPKRRDENINIQRSMHSQLN